MKCGFRRLGETTSLDIGVGNGKDFKGQFLVLLERSFQINLAEKKSGNDWWVTSGQIVEQFGERRILPPSDFVIIDRAILAFEIGEGPVKGRFRTCRVNGPNRCRYLLWGKNIRFSCHL